MPGLATLALLLVAFSTDFAGLRTRLEHLTQDWLLKPQAGRVPPVPVTVVDIDRESLTRLGPWPWPRELQARLLGVIAQQAPAAIGIDIAYLDPDRSSPAALARQLGRAAGRDDIAALATTLPDGDKALAEVIGSLPTVAGLLVEPDKTGNSPPPMVVTLEGSASDVKPWQANGLRGPEEPVLSAATGTGVLSLVGDEDGNIRSAPLLVSGPDGAYAGLSLEMLRMVAEVGIVTLHGEARSITLGPYTLPLGKEAKLLLRPSSRADWQRRTLSAHTVMALPATDTSLSEHLVLLGGSAPELGALRSTAMDAATPSVQIHADALTQLLLKDLPQPGLAPSALLALLTGAGLAGIVLGVLLAPLAGLLAAIGLGMGWLVLMHFGLARSATILPMAPLLFLAAPFLVTALYRFARTFAQERALRSRFSQRLAPEVVDQIAANPSLLKLEGTSREITVLFTDIEGFTALTERLDPRDVISLLDRYMERVSEIVMAHGGMVDKIVGDAVHAIFNAPVDLVDHASKAIRCAQAILAATRALQDEPAIKAKGLGRTRIGIETGVAVVGDVGGRVRLDYTAHGNVINTAARLEAANKELGSSICIGPIAAAAQQGIALLPLGAITIRGLSQPLQVFTPEA